MLSVQDLLVFEDVMQECFQKNQSQDIFKHACLRNADLDKTETRHGRYGNSTPPCPTPNYQPGKDWCLLSDLP